MLEIVSYTDATGKTRYRLDFSSKNPYQRLIIDSLTPYEFKDGKENFVAFLKKYPEFTRSKKSRIREKRRKMRKDFINDQLGFGKD